MGAPADALPRPGEVPRGLPATEFTRGVMDCCAIGWVVRLGRENGIEGMLKLNPCYVGD
jgi:hypothetical protein